MIEQYFQSLLDLLATLPFVESSDVSLEKRGELVGFVRGTVEFQEGSSLLFFRELIDMRLPLQKIMYAYHFQKASGELIFCYDNTSQALAKWECSERDRTILGTGPARD